MESQKLNQVKLVSRFCNYPNVPLSITDNYPEMR